MTVLDKNSRIQYTASHEQTNFEYPFKIFVQQDIAVYQTLAGQTPDPDADKLVFGTDYTLTGLEDDNGGEVILIIGAAVGDLLTLERSVVKNRPPEFNYIVGGEFTAQKLNENFDKMFILLQQMQDLLQNRGLLYQVTDEIGKGQTTLPKLGAAKFWTANSAGNLVDVTIENTDVDALRSELLSQSETAPGSDNIGTYDITTHQGKNLTVMVNELLHKHVFQTGFVVSTIGTDYDEHITEGFWVFMRDRSIGNAVSGAGERANADTENLFKYIWDHVDNLYSPVQDSSGTPVARGASAQSDYVANRRIVLPRSLGRALVCAGAGGGLTPRNNGAWFGDENTNLTEEQNGPHTHSLKTGCEWASWLEHHFYAQTNSMLGDIVYTQSAEVSGEGAAHTNMQPSFCLNFLMKL